VTTSTSGDGVTTTRAATTFERIAAIARRDFYIEMSYQFALLARAGAIFSTVITFFFIGRIVDPHALGSYGDRYFEFALVGLMVATISAVGLSTFTETIRSEQEAGTLEVLLATPTSLATLFIGALVVPICFALVETGFVFLVAVLLGAHFDVTGTLTVILALPPTLAVYAAFGGLSASFIILSKRGDPFTPVVTQITNFLGGALFPVAVLPDALQVVAHLLPPYYALQVLRAGLLRGESIIDVGGDYLILVGFAVVLFPLSLLLLRRALQTARDSGTLGSY
jgi:ABC-2 type transport system permease protein